MPLEMRAVVEVQRDLEGDASDRVFRIQADKRLAEHVALTMAMIQEVGYPLIGAKEVNAEGGKQGGVGSYVNRPIKNQNGEDVPSEHSRAKAFDLWTRSNPQRFTANRHAFRSTWHPDAIRIVAAGDWDWGGWFWDQTEGRYSDCMHIQYRKRPEDVAESTRKMIAEYERMIGEPEDGDVTKEEVKALQEQLNAIGTEPPLVVDGVYGPITHAAVLGMEGLVQSRLAKATVVTREATKEAAVEAVSAI